MIHPLTILEGTASIFIMLLIGYFAGGLRILKMETVKGLIDLTFKVTFPLLLFSTLAKIDRVLLTPLSLLVVYGFGFSVLTGLVTYIISVPFRFDRKTRAAVTNIGIMSNTTFVGYPVALTLFGQDGLVRAMFYDLGATFVVVVPMVISAIAAAKQLDRHLLRSVLTTPLLGAMALGVLWSFMAIPVPSLVENIITPIGKITLPLILLALGAYVHINRDHIRKERRSSLILALALRLVLLPFLAFLLCLILNIVGLDKDIVILQNAMPPAIFTSVLAITYDLDQNLALAAILIGTVLSSITVPVILMILL